jgi:flagellar hook protein FlgE
MSVTSAMMSGVTGLLSNAEAINVIGNNISNVNTAGFKYGQTLFSDILSNTVSNNSQIGTGTQVQAVQNIFSQGASMASENPTDISISGKGFFVVQDSSATPSTYYTRAGAFHVDEKGKYLVNPDGMRLCDSSSTPIDVSAFTKFDKISDIGLDGKISYLDTDGATQVATPAIGIATFANVYGLSKSGGNMYKENLATGGSGKATVAAASVNDKILGRSLEQSNVDIAAQMINLITTQRAYSANSKTITTGDEMMQEVIGLKR